MIFVFLRKKTFFSFFFFFISRASSCATTLVVSDNSSIEALVRTLDAEEHIKSTIFRLHPFTFALFVPVDWIALLANDRKIHSTEALSVSNRWIGPYRRLFLRKVQNRSMAFSYVSVVAVTTTSSRRCAFTLLSFCIRQSWTSSCFFFFLFASFEIIRTRLSKQLSWESLCNFHDTTRHDREIIFFKFVVICICIVFLCPLLILPVCI